MSQVTTWLYLFKENTQKRQLNYSKFLLIQKFFMTAKSHQLYLTLPTPGSQPTRQEYWNGLPRPPPGDLPDPGFEPMSPTVSWTGIGTLVPPGKCYLSKGFSCHLKIPTIGSFH